MDPATRARHALDEFGEDLNFQRRFWATERAAWILFTLLLVAALAGAAGGGGVLAHEKVNTAYGSIEYPRISRWQAADDLIVTVERSRERSVSVELDSRFAENFEIVSIQPEPRSAAATPLGVHYLFDVVGGGEIVFQLRATRPAILPEGAVRVDGAETPVRPVILP